MELALRVTILAALIGGCAHDVRVRFPSRPDEPTGTLILLLSQPASGVTIAVNGVLVAEDEHTRRITIEKLPTGTNEIAITANGGDKQLRAWIESDNPTTVPLGVPEATAGIVKSVVGALVSIVAYSLLR